MVPIKLYNQKNLFELEIASEGRIYLGETNKTDKFKDKYMEQKVVEWINNLNVFSKVAAV